MSVDLLDHLLADPDPAFECKAIRGVPDSERHIEPLTHFANPPAEAALVESLPDVPGREAAEAFYRKYNGALLYTDRATETAGVEIFPIEWWPERTASMVESWTIDEQFYPDDEMPYDRNDFIAFAYSRGASNCVHWVVRGPRAGSVYGWEWTNPPQRETPPIAKSFGEFLKLLYERPVYFFNDLYSCNTRFTNARPLVEWLPARYLPDRREPTLGR
jgi:hypothetical protein